MLIISNFNLELTLILETSSYKNYAWINIPYSKIQTLMFISLTVENREARIRLTSIPGAYLEPCSVPTPFLTFNNSWRKLKSIALFLYRHRLPIVTHPSRAGGLRYRDVRCLLIDFFIVYILDKIMCFSYLSLKTKEYFR